MERGIKKSSLKNGPLELQKQAFIDELKKNGGLVGKALEKSQLPRVTAYRHFQEDEKFTEAWLAALEESHDALYAEAVRRATVGDVRYRTIAGKKISYHEKSDTLLIFLLKHSEYKKKWRSRLVQTGQLAINTVQERGNTIGLTAEQIEDIQLAITEKLTSVSLV